MLKHCPHLFNTFMKFCPETDWRPVRGVACAFCSETAGINPCNPEKEKQKQIDGWIKFCVIFVLDYVTFMSAFHLKSAIFNMDSLQ